MRPTPRRTTRRAIASTFMTRDARAAPPSACRSTSWRSSRPPATRRSCRGSRPTAAAATSTSRRQRRSRAAINYAVQHGFARVDRLRHRREPANSAGQPDRRHGESRRNGAQRQPARAAAEHRRHRQSRRAAAAAAQQHAADGRLLAAGLRRRAASLPRLSAGAGQHQADRLEVRQRRHASCGRTSTAGPTWPGRPACPADPNARNIYTFIPDGCGGGSVVAFTTANEATLRAHMNIVGRPTGAHQLRPLAAARRGHRLDAGDHGRRRRSIRRPTTTTATRDAAGTFAGNYKDRRALIFFGANNGMIHAVDARTGYEVWAFIPYNLLPKLQHAERRSAGRAVRLLRRQLAEDRRSEDRAARGAACCSSVRARAAPSTRPSTSPKRAWVCRPSPTTSRRYRRCSANSIRPNESIEFKWSFPNYSSFDPTYTGDFHRRPTATPGGKVKMYRRPEGHRDLPRRRPSASPGRIRPSVR